MFFKAMIFSVFLLLFNVTFAYKGRPQRHHIIDPSLTEPVESLLNLPDINSQNLVDFVGDLNGASSETALRFLTKYGIIPNERECPHCPSSRMSLVSDKSVQLGLYWRCSKCKSSKVSTKIMIRDGSFFEGSKLSIQKTLLLAADWIESPGRSTEATSKLFQVNHETVIQMYRSFRQLTEQWVAREMESTLKLGGVGKIVEIDESHMFKAKHNRGRMLSRKAVWIFGMVERSSNKVLMFQVEKRDAATLLPLIKDHVLNGSMVVSDGWSSYGGIPQIQANFTHRWVNHKLNFVNPTDRRVHTQSIEATWGAFKRELKSKFGIPDENLGEYMAVYMFRRFFRRERLLNHLLIEMKTFGRRRNQLETTSQSPSDDSSQDDEEPIEDPEDADGTYRSENEHSDENSINVDNLLSDDEEVYSASDDSLPHNPSTMESDYDSDNSRPPPEKKSKRKLSGSSTQVTGKQTRRGRKPGASRRESVNGGRRTRGNTHVRGQQRRGTGAGRVQSTSGQRRTDGNTSPLSRGQSSDRGQTQRRGRQEQLSDTQDRGDVTIRRGTLRVRVNSGSVMGDRRGQSPTETGGRRPGRAQRARGRGQNLRRGHSSRVQTSRTEAVTRTQQSGGARGRGRSSRGSTGNQSARSGRSKGGRGK